MTDLDLGGGFSYRFFQWAPDRDLNPQYADIPDVPKAGITVLKDGIPIGSCHFDLPEVRAIPGVSEEGCWQLISLDPLHLEPSLQTYEHTYGDQTVPAYHGWIRDGKWVSA